MPHESGYDQPPYNQFRYGFPGNGESDGKGSGDHPGVSDGLVDEHGTTILVEGDSDDQDPFGLDLPF